MLISHYEHLVEVDGMTWGLDTALRGASERLAPILMTALVTGLGLLPLAIGSGDPGREIEGPMATVILGGLVTSTLLHSTVPDRREISALPVISPGSMPWAEITSCKPTIPELSEKRSHHG
jgi:AcrB/AcrD/AcrF family protein